jgi:predicted DCC family thiol-disulfide oxidoreductase YuxK
MGTEAKTPERTPWSNRLGEFLRTRYLSADPRWLGVLRVALGTLLCVDVLRRWVAARAFYTNDGLFPNHFSLFRPMGRNVFSIYHAFSTLGEVSLAFAITLAIFVLFTIGFKTKLFHILAFVCITGLNARNIFVENGGTVVVNLLTFWTLFLPLGRRLSVDALLSSLRKRREQTAEDLNQPLERDTSPAVSLVVLALILQWTVIYFFNAVHKNGVGWRDGSALWWFWQQDRIVTWLGIWARENVPLRVVHAMTYGTLVVEGALSVILLVPFWQTWLRRAALLLALSLHGGIALSSRLGPFSYVMTIFFVMLLGERDWQLLGRWFGRPARARTVIYDADCGICLLTCRIIKRLDLFERLTFVANVDRERIPAGIDASLLERTAVVVDTKGRVFTEERAVFEAGRALPLGILLVGWTRVPGLHLVARALYRAIARNRMELSVFFGLSACGVDAPKALAPPPSDTAPIPLAKARGAAAESSTWRSEVQSFGILLRESTVALMIIALGSQVAIENRYLRKYVTVRQPEWMALIVNYPRLFQGWGMFAPEPPYDDGRFVVDGRTIDGRKLDPLTGKQPEFDPHAPEGWGHDQFWCDYHNRILFPGHSGNRHHLREYLLNLHRYRGRPQDQLTSFDVWWVHDRSPPFGVERGEPMPPQKLVSHGYLRDSGATPWLARRGQRP